MVKGSVTLKINQIKSAREVLIINIIVETMLIKAIVEKLDDIFFMAKFFWFLIQVKCSLNTKIKNRIQINAQI